jgi:hypothetical protein
VRVLQNNWTNNPTEALSTVASFSDSNVDLATTSSSWWRTYVGGNAGIIAYTVPVETDGTWIYSATQVQNTTGYVHIVYAGIFFNPTTPSEVAKNDTMQLQTIVHEMGHVYGMGHTATTNSIMYYTVSTITQLTPYDINVMNSFYHSM